MEDAKRIVFVIGPPASGKSTLVELITGNKAPQKLEIVLNPYKFDLITWNTPAKKTRGIYTSNIDNLKLLEDIIRLRKPRKSYVLTVFPFNKEKLSFSQVSKITHQARDFCTFICSTSEHATADLLFAVSKFDLFLGGTSAEQIFNKSLLANLTFYHRASLITFTCATFQPQVAESAKGGFLRFIGDEPELSTASLLINFEWRVGEKNCAYVGEHTLEEKTLETLRSVFGDELPSPVKEYEAASEVDEGFLACPELDNLMAAMSAELSFTLPTSDSD